MKSEPVESIHLSAVVYLPWSAAGMTAQFEAASQTSVGLGALGGSPEMVRTNVTTRLCGELLLLWSGSEVAIVEHQEGFRPGRVVLDSDQHLVDAVAFQGSVYVLTRNPQGSQLLRYSPDGEVKGKVELSRGEEEGEYIELLALNDQLYLVQNGITNATFLENPVLIELSPEGEPGPKQYKLQGKINGKLYGNGNTIHFIQEVDGQRFQVSYRPTVQSKIQSDPQGKEEYPFLGTPIGIDGGSHIYGTSGWNLGKVDPSNRFLGSVALDNVFVQGNDIWYSRSEGEDVVVVAQNGLGTEERFRINTAIEGVQQYQVQKWVFRGFDQAGDLILSGRAPRTGKSQYLTFHHGDGALLGTAGSWEDVKEYHHQLTVPQSWSIDDEGGIWMASLGPMGIYVFRGELH